MKTSINTLAEVNNATMGHKSWGVNDWMKVILSKEP